MKLGIVKHMESLDRWKSVLNDSERQKRYSSYVRAWEDRIGSFLEFDPARGRRAANGESAKHGNLAGLPFAVKDNIAVEGFHLTCGSKILEGFLSPYTATAVSRLEAAGAVVVGKTNLDEFGMGSSTENSALGKTSNPWDLERVAGGSSGGSAAAVAAGLVPFALGSDTGGSIRQPAAFCGVYGLKPTYGTVSRFGLVAYASSLEGIGVLSEDVDLVREVFQTMQGVDPLDHSTVEAEHIEPVPEREKIAVGVISNIGELDPAVEQAYREAIKNLEGLQMPVTEVELPSLEFVVPAYYTIATAEASANLARFNGIRYGHRPEWAENPEELVRKARNEGFGPEVKLRILLGTYVLRSGFQDQYYIRAQKIRTAIRLDFDRAFEKVQTILMPVFPTPAFERGAAGLTPFQQKLADKFTVTANLAGIPALTFPSASSSGVPVGLQFMGPAFSEERLFSAAKRYASQFPPRHPDGYDADWRS
ncbi:MAG TPA: Asp-tRNA(Asn)/Glu-tRNA(Gln) amidotransferase subunit GatA [Spirochaetia bacterium]|nr:Asp-tRNA(Asn)/Glu-tRNA(Gln) amidotransferase subunit GatA [Spirochaetia bacterium]